MDIRHIDVWIIGVSTTTPSIIAQWAVHKCVAKPLMRRIDPPVSSKSGKPIRVRKITLLHLRGARNLCPKQKTFQKLKTLNIIEDSELEPVRDISGQTYSLYKS